MQQVLPYIDQAPVYNEYMAWNGLWVMDAPPAIKDLAMSVFMCPSDPSNPAFGGGGGPRAGGNGFQGNYVVCAGNVQMNANTDSGGMFFGISSRRMRDVVDGTSNTLFLSEVIIRGKTGTSWGEGGGYWGGGRGGSYGFITEEPPNTPLPDQVYQCKSTTFPMAPCTSLINYNYTKNFARSYHIGGVQAGMGDGSVRFISSSIDRALFQALGTRQGMETVGEF
jgi:hypothetical protein